MIFAAARRSATGGYHEVERAVAICVGERDAVPRSAAAACLTISVTSSNRLPPRFKSKTFGAGMRSPLSPPPKYSVQKAVVVDVAEIGGERGDRPVQADFPTDVLETGGARRFDTGAGGSRGEAGVPIDGRPRRRS